MITPAQEHDILLRLLKKKPPERFAAKKLAGKGYWRWNRGENLEAAVLFDAAAIRSVEEVRQARPARDNTFNYRVRAGVNFRLAGEYERAWPILVKATTFDWQAAGIPEDSHCTEWAFFELLSVLAERGDTAGFTKLFWQAVQRGEELKFPFPRIHTKQEQLLDQCQRMSLKSELAHVIARTKERGKLPRELARRISDLESASWEPQP
jgi:hypothetical protein